MRYIGPKWRINRRENYTVLGKNEKWRKRNTLPGQFPVLLKKPSDYAFQFREKQKVKRLYGLSEKQLKNLYKKAIKSEGNTSLKFLQLLEMRLDNVVYRLGFALTRSHARQIVNHGHVLLNGKKNNIPSTTLRVGDEVTLKDSILQSVPVIESVSQQQKRSNVPSWLEVNEKGGRVVAEPIRQNIDMNIKENLIIELYSR